MEQESCSLNSHLKKKSGKIAFYMENFIKQLTLEGYTSHTINGYVGSISHFGWWLNNQGIDLGEIKESTIVDFGEHECTCPGNRSQKKYPKNI
jgi:site-specific recombinase XerD